MSAWILIEAEHPKRWEDFEHVVIGPFNTEAEVVRHLEDSLQVQGMCADDAIDAWWVETTAEKDAITRAWTRSGDDWGTYSVVKDLP